MTAPIMITFLTSILWIQGLGVCNATSLTELNKFDRWTVPLFAKPSAVLSTSSPNRSSVGPVKSGSLSVHREGWQRWFLRPYCSLSLLQTPSLISESWIATWLRNLYILAIPTMSESHEDIETPQKEGSDVEWHLEQVGRLEQKYQVYPQSPYPCIAFLLLCAYFHSMLKRMLLSAKNRRSCSINSNARQKRSRRWQLECLVSQPMKSRTHCSPSCTSITNLTSVWWKSSLRFVE